jgi:hypothetical protein
MTALFSTADELLTSGARLEKLIVAHPALVTTFKYLSSCERDSSKRFFSFFFRLSSPSPPGNYISRLLFFPLLMHSYKTHSSFVAKGPICLVCYLLQSAVILVESEADVVDVRRSTWLRFTCCISPTRAGSTPAGQPPSPLYLNICLTLTSSTLPAIIFFAYFSDLAGVSIS